MREVKGGNWAARLSVGLHRGRHGQADGLLRAAHVSHDKVGRQRVEPPGDTLHRTVEALQVDGHVGFVLIGQGSVG